MSNIQGDSPEAPTGGPAQIGPQVLAAAIAQQLAQVLPGALAAVLAQVPVRTVPQPTRYCATCAVNRISWENVNRAALEAAQAAALQAACVAPGSPEAAQLDFGPFLPEHLRPGAVPNGIPMINNSLTTVDGREVCPAHIPGVQGGRPALLVAQPTINLSALTG